MKSRLVKMGGLVFTHVEGSDEMEIITNDRSKDTSIPCDDVAWENFMQHLLHQKPIIFSVADVV